MRFVQLLLLSLLLSLVAAPEAWAQSEADKTTARALAMEAQKALEAGDFEKAADNFKRAEKLYHAPTLLVGLGRAYKGMGKYVEAMESFNAVIRDKMADNATDAFLQAVADAKREVEGLDQKIAWVTIRVEGPDDPGVTLDGVEVSVASLGVKRAVNPGDHELVASGDGWAEARESFSVGAGESKEVALTLTVDPNAKRTTVGPGGGDTGPGGDDDSIMPIIGWTAIGVGGASLILGAVMGGLAMGKHGELSDNCPGGACASDQQDTLDSFRTFGLVSTIGFIAGGVLAAGGVVILLVAPSGDSASAGDVALGFGVGHAQATLRF